MSRKALSADDQVARYSRHVDCRSMSKIDQQKSGKIGYRSDGTFAKRTARAFALILTKPPLNSSTENENSAG